MLTEFIWKAFIGAAALTAFLKGFSLVDWGVGSIFSLSFPALLALLFLVCNLEEYLRKKKGN
ncbi:MAG: hypothetical protein HY579_09425 [Nitrospinae bacterium]|nr:hypothetical protein [Nitrospinota bacterium]